MFSIYINPAFCTKIWEHKERSLYQFSRAIWVCWSSDQLGKAKGKEDQEANFRIFDTPLSAYWCFIPAVEFFGFC